ncbi:SusC/RagA family TonB-linked outer membrane protein [Flavivirga sp. 57AJ16]|uniref:SusC/RagA family TonB-linked outer membrane protein n=1 Tax=Flavivirga sp. 57AJ16 TaxID=3025307 RepID=UPI002365F4DB|nr:SusC/RagA family TonB-linked outer membrane protein [Flavivirga sp. 57AJ16]MDD7886430.1 SusC/RagA family TonB-linked outer membrane protein [Flavivirga sp. 57AJ16]
MKTKFSVMLTLLLVLVTQLTFAQKKTISGTVSDNSGLPLPGTSVIIKGTTSGTSSNFDGKYSIEVSQGETLVFTFIGYATKEIVVGSSNTIDVLLQEDTSALDEVVVTALGIERDKKSLGYATQEVKGEAVSDVKSQNFVNSLSGKIAGLQIKPSGTMGGSTQVIIRGNSSVLGNNQALFVIDGIPVNNGINNKITTAIASESRQQTSGRGGYDYGNAASDINPDDIESINVLKGAAASALYGSRAANGVIMITTKKGRKKKGIGITVNSSITVGEVDKSTLPVYQKKYGAGYGAFYGATEDQYFNDQFDINGDGTNDLSVPFTEDASYGAEFDPNLLVYQWNSLYPQLDTYLTPTPWVAGAHDPNYIWKTSSTLINSVSLDGGSETGAFRLGFTNMLQEGNLPNSEIKRNSINFNGSQDLNDKLTVSTTFTFTKTDGRGRYGTGYDSNNVMQQFRQWWQVNVDVKEQKEAYFATRENITWNPNSHTNLAPIYSDNPYWTFYENFETDTRSRFFGNVVLNYTINDWLSALGRFTYDTYTELQEERTNVGSSNVPLYTRFNNSASEYNYDAFLNFNKDLTDMLNLEGSVGVNLSRKEWNNIYALTNGGLNLAGIYTLANSVNPINAPTEYDATQMTDGIFGRASLGYDNTLFVEGTFRRDRNSSLPKAKNTYNYWSVTGSLILSKLIEADWLSFAKLRANYGTVGNGTTPYQVFNTYGINPPFGGSGSASNPSDKQNPDLKPEQQVNWEVGLEMNFVNKRLGFDITYYNTENRDQITQVPVTRSTGYSRVLLNAGTIENKGIELQLNAIPLKTEDFQWYVNINWDRNRNKVLSLLDGIESLELADFQTGLTINAVVGQPYGTIRGRDFVYTNGEKTVGANGRYLRTATSNNNIGDINPDWKAGISNSFTYKNFNFSFLIDIQKGGDVFSLDTYYGFGTGIYDFTAGNNELGNPYRDPVTGTPGNYGSDSGGVIFPGVKEDGTPNDIRAHLLDAGTWGYRQPQAAHVYDAGYVKLREATLSYKLNDKILDKFPFTSASISLIGRNLWIIEKHVPYADPEAGLSAGNVQGNQSGAYPSVKEIGASIKLQF